MNGIKDVLITGLLVTGLASCTHDDFLEDHHDADDGVGLKIEVTDEFVEKATRADYSGFPATTFEEGDAIGVYTFDGSSYVNKNIKFTRQADGSWVPASPVAYNPDYTYYAYFPWRSTTYTPSTSGTVDEVDTKFSNFISDASNYFWKANQSTKENFTASNLMIAKGLVTGTRTVKFTMQHKRGLAIIGNAPNKWYYTDAIGTKYEMAQVFSGNIPYNDGTTQYFLLKPNTATSVGGLSLRAGAGKYMTSVGGEITGSISSWKYRTSSNLGSSWSSWTSTKPSWLTITTQTEDGEPTEFLVTTTNSTSTTTSKGTGNSRDVPGDATLKAASPVSDVDLSMVDNAGSERASRTTANCYLVHAPGTYKIPLVYGNAIKNGNEASTAAFYTSNSPNTLQRLVNHSNVGITSPWIKTQLGSCPDGAQLIWEDVKGMISSVGIDTSGNGFLTFTVDADNIAEGNAVIAATLSGTIVWSWHVWVTPETLANTTLISTGSHDYTVAPVNVGQVNGRIKVGATIYAGDLCQVRATANGITVEFQITAKDYPYGGTTRYYPSPYYQWGRKDAMYPCTGAFNSAGNLISTYSGSTRINSTSATPGATIQHPDYWYYNTSNFSPYGTSSTYAYKYNYWNMNQNTSGNITTATVKTVYDPCPPGFCVPTDNLYTFMGNNGTRSDDAWTTSQGKTWSATTYSANTTGNDLFFPASGRRDVGESSCSYIGSTGYYWSTSDGRSLAPNSMNWQWLNNYSGHGCPVRAVAEE